jgi:hypothetical protein
MHKSHSFDVLCKTSRCTCGKYIKQRLVDNKPTVRNCYKAYKINRNKGLNRKKARFVPVEH